MPEERTEVGGAQPSVEVTATWGWHHYIPGVEISREKPQISCRIKGEGGDGALTKLLRRSSKCTYTLRIRAGTSAGSPSVQTAMGWMCMYVDWMLAFVNQYTHSKEGIELLESSRFLRSNQLVFIERSPPVKPCIIGCEERFQSWLLLCKYFLKHPSQHSCLIKSQLACKAEPDGLAPLQPEGC